MNRGNFFKSFLTLVVAPKLLSNIDLEPYEEKRKKSYDTNRKLIHDLQLLTPKYYEHLKEKYSSEDYNSFYYTSQYNFGQIYYEKLM
jgi:hypothetical protein